MTVEYRPCTCESYKGAMCPHPRRCGLEQPPSTGKALPGTLVPVRVTHDTESGAAYVYLSSGTDRKSAHTEEVRHGNKSFILDFDKEGRLIGIEVFTKEALSSMLLP